MVTVTIIIHGPLIYGFTVTYIWIDMNTILPNFYRFKFLSNQDSQKNPLLLAKKLV